MICLNFVYPKRVGFSNEVTGLKAGDLIATIGRRPRIVQNSVTPRTNMDSSFFQDSPIFI